jgi:diguanylate cyclase (GGDEF)-like protein
MRIRGLFLRSRIARRTFWVLVAAALLPLLLFGLLATQVYLADRDAELRRQESDYLKYLGLRAFDNLSAAGATLAAVAANGKWQQPSGLDGALPAFLQRVATVGKDGQLNGDAGLVQAWREAQAAAGPHRGQRKLWWLPATGERAATVIIERPDVQSRGQWLAEVAPAFLWADFVENGPAAALCMTDAKGRPLQCPVPSEAGAPSRSLFMKAAFGSGDWVLSGRPPRLEAGLQDHVLQVAAAGGAATLLLIATLGLILVRRTMVPLEQLTAGTQRLANGDWGTRVDDSRADEFGQLAGAFNLLAGRLGRQVQALGVQADIDRELLGRLEVNSVLRLVVRRLQTLAPRAQVAVVARRADGVRWQAVRESGVTDGLLLPKPEVLAKTTDGLAMDLDDGQAAPAWVRQALGVAPDAGICVSLVPASWQEEVVAVLLLACPRGDWLDEDGRRELEALRDRCALAIAADERERRLVERAVRDELTGLLNHHGMNDACDQRLAAEGGAQPATAVLIDLDGFKEVNDSMGHNVGDALLRAVADRLQTLAPEGSIVARPGGDEFFLLVPAGVDDEALAGEICRRLGQPFMAHGQVQHIGASVGLARRTDEGLARDELMRRADLAMYAAKAEGKGQWRLYSDTLDAKASERAWIVRDLHTALANGMLDVHYQPRLDLRSGRTCSAEALVRWHHPVHGMVSPLRFIPVAEESDLIIELGHYVLDRALAQRRRWLDDGLSIERVAVNVSIRQLRDPSFPDRILALLSQHGLQPHDLEIELTESLFAGDVGSVERALAPLRALGVMVALDDFGTGYSSLSALQHLPVDVMKIDRSFVIDLGQKHAADAVVRSVIALARDLGKRVVAEGVETALQQQRLVALGCDEVQGYRYAKPLASEAFIDAARTGFDAPLGVSVSQPVMAD